ncbi:hypothetical protein CBC_A1365 [Clostridium botulinum C str. Eklund]|nr:hypothetical protein CBC_A1365 [Clostridium botulinum C str. Eklund]
MTICYLKGFFINIINKKTHHNKEYIDYKFINDVREYI